MSNLRFKSFSQTTLVHGFLRSVIVDHDRQKIFFFPKELLQKIEKNIFDNSIAINEIKKIIIENELGIFVNDDSMFSDITCDFEDYSIIDNMVVCLSDFFNVDKLIKVINYCQTKALKILVKNIIPEQLNDLILKLFNSPIEHLVFVFENDLNLDKVEFAHPAIFFIHVNNLENNVVKKIPVFGKQYWPMQSLSFLICLESQKYHTYYNRKLYIGPKGEIKNALECDESFGIIDEIIYNEDLKKIISTRSFQKYWVVNKEICDICKHCELRHICIDNRIPFQRSENEWYHKIECQYNPYISKWSHEDGFRTLAECGVISNENEFSIDHNRIAEINKEIWEEE